MRRDRFTGCRSTSTGMYLNEFVHAGDLVLEAGAGAGRFTVELARLGARIVATDISPGQLELNAIHLAEAGLEQQIEARGAADILDLSSYPDRSFDAVVCYGGPLSYVMDRADDALDELLRVTKLGGHLLLGVMSKHGSLHAFLGSAAAEIEEFGIEEMEAILETGDLPPNHSSMGMPVHLFSWADLRGRSGPTSVRSGRRVGLELPLGRERRSLRTVAAGSRDVGAVPGVGGRRVRAAGRDRRRNAHHRRDLSSLTRRGVELLAAKLARWFIASRSSPGTASGRRSRLPPGWSSTPLTATSSGSTRSPARARWRAHGALLPEETLEAIRDCRVAIKGPITTPVGTGFRSVNVALRQELDLFAAVRPARALPGVPIRHPATNLVVVRENTEDLYQGIEFERGSPEAAALREEAPGRSPASRCARTPASR